MSEVIGLCAAAAPRAWLTLFDTDASMIDAGSRYLGPLYGLFGLGMALYFASQGAGRLLWPFLANMARLIIAAGGGWLALRWIGNLTEVFIALAAALAAFGLINAAAVAGYPNINVTEGFVSGLPVGISFFGRAWSEPTLIKLAYSFEQATKARQAPRFLPSVG